MPIEYMSNGPRDACSMVKIIQNASPGMGLVLKQSGIRHRHEPKWSDRGRWIRVPRFGYFPVLATSVVRPELLTP